MRNREADSKQTDVRSSYMYKVQTHTRTRTHHLSFLQDIGRGSGHDRPHPFSLRHFHHSIKDVL